jgi:hypothetical protein
MLLRTLTILSSDKEYIGLSRSLLGAPITGEKSRRYGFTLLVTGHGDIDAMLGVHPSRVLPSLGTNVLSRCGRPL